MKFKNTNFFMNYGLSCVLLSYLFAGCGAPYSLEGPAGAEGPRGQNGVGITEGPTVNNLTCVSGSGGLLSGSITNNGSAPAICQLICGTAIVLVSMQVSTFVDPNVPTAFDQFRNVTPLGAATYFCYAECVGTGSYSTSIFSLNCT